MYLDFYGFDKHPFHISADSDFLYVSQQHARAMVYMDYATWKPGGFVVITGEIGTGKTTLIKWLQNKVSEKTSCLLIEFTNLTGNELFYYLLKQADIVCEKDDRISLIYHFREYLVRCFNRGNPCVLIIDEAQNLTKDQLEDIRMLAALEGPDGPLLRVALLAQPEFVDTIESTEQFKQRVKLHYHLTGLSSDDTNKYIDYRLLTAGLNNSKLFTEDITNKVFEYSNGIPRLINKICDALLMCAYAEERLYLNVDDLEGVLSDLMLTSSIKEHKNHGSRSEVNGCSEKTLIDVLGRVALAMEDINRNIIKIAENQ